MNVKIKQLLAALTLGLGLLLTVLTLLNPGRFGPTNAHAAGIVRYVAPGGTDSSNTCTNSNTPCASVQHAVDAANSGDEIRIAAGTYSGVSFRDGFTQVVYIDKSVTLRGGYTSPNWSTPNPDTNPTILNAQGLDGSVAVTGTINVTLEGLKITGGSTSGIGVFSATVTLRNNAVVNNTGGGIALFDAGGTLSNNLIDNNNGGGVFLYESSATLTDNTISNNQTTDTYGSGVFLFISDNTVLSGNLIDGNTCSGSYCQGGGVFIAGSKNVTLSNNIISHNRVTVDGLYGAGFGGGVALYEGTFWLNNNSIISNTSSHSGGGVHMYYNAQVTFTDNLISGNEAADGGGVSMRYGGNNLAILEDNIISGNLAEYGGGMTVELDNRAYLSRNIISGNSAEVFGGGLVLIEGEAMLTNTVIADNRAETAGSGLYIGNASARLLHTTLARNNGGDGSGIYVGYDSTVGLTNTILVSHNVGITIAAGSTVSMEGTLWGSGDWANDADWGGTGNITTGTINVWGDPVFASPESGNYHLRSGSDALDQGINAGVTTDIDGESRPYGGGYDLGADEGQPGLTVTKQAGTNLVKAGKPLTYTIRVTNTGYISLTTTITDILPTHVTPTGILIWTPTITVPGGVWMEQIAVTVEEEYARPLTNIVQVTSEEGAAGIYTQTLTVGHLYYLPIILRND